jgi:siroheme synthase (precorrin-2 oxidase/ferrochelatase)
VKSKLDRLIDAVCNPDDVAEMSREEIQAYLEEEGIDLTEAKERLAKWMEASRKERKANAAPQ